MLYTKNRVFTRKPPYHHSLKYENIIPMYRTFTNVNTRSKELVSNLPRPSVKVSNTYLFTLHKNRADSNNSFTYQKKKVNSNASRQSFSFKTKLPVFNLKYKNLFYKGKSIRGRSYGAIVCRTKGRRLFNISYPQINKNLRNLSLVFILGFYINTLNHKMYSLCTTSSGEVFYNLTTPSQSLFKVLKRYSILGFIHNQGYDYLSDFIKLPQLFFTLCKLPKYKLINSLEIYPPKGVQYSTAPGSKSFITKVNIKMNFVLIKLPSGVHKIFSTFSTGCLGQTSISFKKLKTQANAGFFVKKGEKVLTRGVAKNPVDHPHGGRNKAIRYQRTP